VVALITKQDEHFAGFLESYSKVLQTSEAVKMIMGLEH